MLAPLDIAVLVLMAITAVIGFWTGFVWQVIRIVSVMASIWIALVYSPVVTGFLGDRIPASLRDLVSAGLVFAAAMAVLFLVGYLFRDIVNALKPQLTDRVLGAGFGVLLGALIAAFFAFCVLELGGEGNTLTARVEETTITRVMGTLLGHALPDSLRQAVNPEKGPQKGESSAPPAVAPAKAGSSPEAGS